MLLALALLQAAGQAPDIELNARVKARSVEIEKKGEAKLIVTASPDSGGNIVDVEAPRADGRKTLRNVEVKVNAEARIGDPQQRRGDRRDQTETTEPERR